jgi:Concanavalin A-like lectin/glucanases superfamily
MLDSAAVSRFASSARYFWFSLFVLLACGSLAACTQRTSDEGPGKLTRHVPASTQNLALSFDGQTQYATTGTAMFPLGRGLQTISAWFELEVIAGKHALITLRKDGDSGVELGLQDGQLGAWRVYGNRTLVIAPTPITVGVWHHAAYTFDMTTNQLYLDGTVVATSASVPDERTPTTSWLGTLDGTNDLFKGSIDDFHVFSTVRSSTQIMGEAAGSFSSADAGGSGLVLDLPCNEEGGDLLYDHSPPQNDASLGPQNDGLLGDGVDSRKPMRVESGAPNDLN